MATVLIGFIGRGRRVVDDPAASYVVYARTTYTFPAEENYPAGDHTTSLFSEALLRRLTEIRRPVSRWVVMGTAQSMWDALIEVVPADRQCNLVEHFVQVSSAVKAKSITQDLLNTWQQALSAELGQTPCLCRLVGPAHTDESQQRVWQALDEAVETGDDIVLDITHGFRHQPVLMTFMIMLLRWLRDVRRVDLYYGAFELKGSNPTCPVLKLPLCNELLQATEAVATFQYTGNYNPIGECLQLSDTFNEDLQAIVFADETNQQAPSAVRRLRNELNDQSPHFNSVQYAISPLLGEALDWVAGATLARRLGRKARFAFDHTQYFKAIALLWEALRVAGCQRYCTGDPMNWQARQEAENRLYSPNNQDLDANKREVLQKVEHLRNAVLHGTVGVKKEVQQALNSPQHFQAIFEAGYSLLNEFLQEA